MLERERERGVWIRVHLREQEEEKMTNKRLCVLGYQSRNMHRAAAGIRPSEGMRARPEGGFLLMPHRDNT